ncbi:MAG: glycosyltransferase family 4 protein [Actinomycetota bacterium]|nr:glycosyltransferase family 4 protein [Actinomycetota bacterium]
MAHLLVTNDFPPKVGGIQSYLWELWRRLDPGTFAILTSSHPGGGELDKRQAFRVERMKASLLLPTAGVRRRVVDLAGEINADLVVLDPALPIGLIGPGLARRGIPYAVVLHGAEVAVPGRLPIASGALSFVLRHAVLAVCAGGYPEAEARRVAGKDMPRVVNIPPGVDVERFVPLDDQEREKARARFGIASGAPLVVSVSRLVPRKGLDILIDAAAMLQSSFPGLMVLIGGAGRDRGRLESRARAKRSPVRFLGMVPDSDLPALYGCADVFVMACRQRWNSFEQEGFGIVFLEAAAAGIPQVAGRSGGAHEAVVDGVTGFVLDDPSDASELARVTGTLLADDGLRCRMGRVARRRASTDFDYDQMARRLARALGEAVV